MAYATRANIEDLWGAEFLADLLPADVDQDVAISRALEQASAEVDAHLSVRYATPIESAPAVLVMPAINIGVYYLAIRQTVLTTTIEDRYRQAVELLTRIAEGKAGLGVDAPEAAAGNGSLSGGDSV